MEHITVNEAPNTVRVSVPTKDTRSLMQRLQVTNPYVRLVIYCLACLLTSCIYFGWQAYSEMMARSGSYVWLCADENGLIIRDPDMEEGNSAYCNSQADAIANLYSYANGSEFVFAAVAGILLDTFGPRTTAIVGQVLHALSFVMLMVSGQSVQLYIPAMFVAGACVNIISFPALTVMEHWPDRRALAVSIIVGCQSAASLVAPVLLAMWDKNPHWTFNGVWGVWLAVVWLPIALVYVWCLPTSRDFDSLAETSLEKQASLTPEADAGCLQLENGSIIDADTILHDTSYAMTNIASKNDGSMTQKELWKRWFKDVRTFDMFLMAFFNFAMMFQFAYYPSVMRSAIGIDVSNFAAWITPLQGPFSIVIGFFMDYTGTTLVMAGMILTLLLVNLSSAFASSTDGGIAYAKFVSFVFVFMQSATYNIKYCFIGDTYDPFNFGKLVGFLGICGGIGVYCSGPLVHPDNYRVIFLSLTAALIPMVYSTVNIGYRQHKGLHHKTVTAVTQTKRIQLSKLFKKNSGKENAEIDNGAGETRISERV